MDDVELMRQAMALAAAVRSTTAPQPLGGQRDRGGRTRSRRRARPSRAPPRPLAARTPRWRRSRPPASAARGGTLYVTLEPCAHHGRTPPCTDAIIAAGVARVVVGIADPDPQVAGRGIAALRGAGVEVTVGVAADEVAEQLAPYLKHRRTGRPWVVLKLAATPRRPHRRPRRHEPVDHRGGGPARRAPPARACPTPSWSGPGRSGPTTPR